jgi:hypothetical protein
VTNGLATTNYVKSYSDTNGAGIAAAMAATNGFTGGNPNAITNTQIGVTLNGNPPPLGNTASGSQSWTEGNTVVASGGQSHAEGNSTIASGISGSHAEGASTTASGGASHAEGEGTVASGNASHAEGNGTIASGDESHAEGIITTASGVRSHTEGYGTIAAGLESYASGFEAVNLGDYSFFWSGDSTFTKRTNTVAQSYNIYAPGGINLLGGVISGNGSGLTNHLAFATNTPVVVYGHVTNGLCTWTTSP